MLPVFGSTTELLVEGKTAEVNVDVVYVKADAGVAFVDKGRLYRGDLVKVLNKNNLSNWVHIQSGRLKGYVPLKVLRFDTRGANEVSDPNMIRRLKEYQYDDQGRRIKASGQRVGSGETDKAPKPGIEKNSQQRAHPVELRFGFGLGRFERRFSSNAPIQSVLSQVQAQPLVFTSMFELAYTMNSHYVLSARLLDYRMGATELQTTVLNEGLPFELGNEGQLIDIGVLFEWTRTNLVLSAGPALSIQRHSFQNTAPIPVFLTSLTTNVGLQACVKAKITGAELSFTGLYARSIDSSQTPLSSGDLNSGLLWSIRSAIQVPVTTTISVVLEGLLSSEAIERLGSSTHVDIITDPATPLTYNASKEENRLSTVLIGITIDL